MPPSNLTPAERETIITMNDEDATAEIWTAQRPVITSLKGNPLAVLTEEGHYGTTIWARFTLPRDRISFLRMYKKMDRPPMSAEERAAVAERLAEGRARKRNV